MTMNKDWLENWRGRNPEITVSNNNKLRTEGSGEVQIEIDSQEVSMGDIMYVPGISTNSLSLNKMVEKCLIVIFPKAGCQKLGKNNCEIKGDILISGSAEPEIIRLRSTKMYTS
ncbi:hypothetical protein JTB14_014747 [Gonioctena quinquepunctata]|nr:hypothetical protein JTB14_014747 [Gonioctena quinquepunctata]